MLVYYIVTIYLKLNSFSSVYEVADNVWFQLFLKVSSTLYINHNKEVYMVKILPETPRSEEVCSRFKDEGYI